MKSVALLVVLSCLPAAAQESPPPKTLGFDLDATNSAPKGFSCSRTGEGRPGVWRVVRDGSAPSQPHVLGQMDADATGYRFPLCVFDQAVGVDVDLSVRMKPMSGREDQ